MTKSKPSSSFLIVPILTMAMSISLSATANSLEWGGSLRVRTEYKDQYNFDDSKLGFSLSQLRLNGKWHVTEKTNIFVELQDARVYGYDAGEIPGIPIGQRNQPFEDHLDIHQAYVNHTFTDGNKLRVGRLKLNLGDQRLVSSLEWVNTARVHDGAHLTLTDTNAKTYDLFASRVVSVDPGSLNDHSGADGVRERYADSQFHGIFMTDKQSSFADTVEAWYFYRNRDEGNDRTHTIGGRLSKEGLGWSWDLQGAYQLGEFGDLDHSAYMLRIGATRDLAGGSLGLGFNLGSGDDDPTDGDHNTFDNLYPLNHAYYGYMDLFSLQNINNVEAIYSRKVGPTLKLRVAYQGFWLDQTEDHWYGATRAPKSAANTVTAISNNADSYVGSEIDITVTYPIKQYHAVLVGGFSHFFTGDYISDVGTDKNANFWFLMFKTTI